MLQNEVIFREDVERILGARPFAAPAVLPDPSTGKDKSPEAPEASAATEPNPQK